MSDNLLNLDPIWQLPSFKGSNGVFEGGDSGHNVFTLLYAGWQPPVDTRVYYNWFITADGWPRRHPDSTKWYGRPGRCSRDLLTPYIVHVAHNRFNRQFYPLLHTMSKHAFLLANNTIRNHVYEDPIEHLQRATPDVLWRPQWKLPDFIGPDLWAVLLRGLMLRNGLWRVLWPALIVLDLHGLASCIGRLVAFKRRNGAVRADDLRNTALKVHFSGTQCGTPVSRLALRLLKLTKPVETFQAYWSAPGQPRVDLYMEKLFA